MTGTTLSQLPVLNSVDANNSNIILFATDETGACTSYAIKLSTIYTAFKTSYNSNNEILTLNLTAYGNIIAGSNLYSNVITTVLGSNHDITIDPDGTGNVIFPTSTELFVQSTATSTSTSTGALVVSGGVGVAGNVYAANVIVGGTIDIFNYVNSTNTQLKSYTDGKVTSSNTQLKAYTDGANTWLQSNDAITLSSAKSYTDTANTWLRSNDAITLTSAKSYTNDAGSIQYGTISSNILGNSTIYIGSTSVTLNRGLGAITLSNTFISPRVNTVTSTSSLTPNANTTDTVTITALSTGITINIPTGSPVDGQKLIFRIKDSGVAQTITWITTTGGYRVVGVSGLPGTTVSNKLLYVGCLYNSLENYWDVMGVSQQ